MARFLIIDGSARYCKVLAGQLDKAGFGADWITSIADLDGVDPGIYDLYILDLVLPDGDGIDLIARQRMRGCRTPIVVVSARTEVRDKVLALDKGADDYLTKPFSLNELVARAKAVLRRPQLMTSQSLLAGKLVLCLETESISVNGRALSLTPAERRLMSLLIRRLGHVVPREVMTVTMAGLSSEHSTNAIEQHVSRLRKVINIESTGVQLKTVRGVGYVLQECQGTC